MVQDGVNGVVTSDVMAAPMLSDAMERRDYYHLSEPEAVHARLWGKPEKNEFHLNYNGHDIADIHGLESEALRVRCYSDGNFQSTPFVQQFCVQALHETAIEVTFHFPCDTVCMRPKRAQNGQAILGQVGHPLIYGVNGLYVPEWDLMVAWYGFDFAWQDAVIRIQDGQYVASIKTHAAVRPFMLLLYPRYYSEHLGYRGFEPWKRRANPKATAGWCSWEAFHDQVTQDDMEHAAECLAPLNKYGLEYLQLDDGFEMAALPMGPHKTVTDAWVTTNDKFPDGHERIVEGVEKYGFKAGLWVAPNITNMPTVEKGGYCLKKADGTGLYGDWIRGVIDCLPETLEKQVVPCFERLKELGYKYIKIDGMRHLTYDGMHEAVRQGLMTGADAFQRIKNYVAAARKGLGEDVYLLSCWGVITPAIGNADGMRVSTDAYPAWCAFSMQLYDTARWFFAQRVMFTIDPDHVCVRAKLEWAKMMLSLVSLTGGLYMISDPPEAYDEERMVLMRKTLPPLATMAAETGPVDLTVPTCARSFRGYDEQRLAYDITYIDPAEKNPFSSLWAHHFEQDGRRWCVAQRCAIVPLPEVEIPLNEMGLDPNRTYYGWDFWKEQPVGVIKGSAKFEALALGETQVFSICDITEGIPCLVGSDRHVSMDLVSVTAMVWDGEQYSMTLKGWDGLTVRYAVYNASTPMQICAAEAADVECENQGDVTLLTVSFRGENAAVSLGKQRR